MAGSVPLGFVCAAKSEDVEAAEPELGGASRRRWVWTVAWPALCRWHLRVQE